MFVWEITVSWYIEVLMLNMVKCANAFQGLGLLGQAVRPKANQFGASANTPKTTSRSGILQAHASQGSWHGPLIRV